MARGVTWQVERAVARAARVYNLWSPGATVVVAVSGGSDSLCLLGALHALMTRGDPSAPGRLIIAHLDHGLRGEAGAQDAEWVRDFAAARGREVALGLADAQADARASGQSIEDAARLARYAFLRRVRAEYGAERICVGHTSDDQLETIVMHWLRGSGLSGLRGMAPLNHDVARPLLTITRAQTEAYCAAHSWEPRADSTNTDTRFLRNRVRLNLIPLLRDYNPNLRETLLRNASLIAADDEYLEAVSGQTFQSRARTSDASVAFALDSLRDTPLAIRHRLFQFACTQLTGAPRLLEATHIHALDRLIAKGNTGGKLTLPRLLRARLDYDTLVFDRHVSNSREGAASANEALHWRLRIPGTVAMPEIGWRLRAWTIALPPGHEREPDPPSSRDPLSRRGTAAELRRTELRVYVDADQTGDTLDVRLWRHGDRFQPLGAPFEKKIQDFFVDAKVPRPERGRIPLVFGRDHLVWVGGQRIDDRVKLTSTTREVLALQLEPLPRDAASDAPGE